MTKESLLAVTPFAFTKQNLAEIKKHIAKYPEGRQQSALLPVLDIAQRQNGGWLSQSCLEAVAEVLAITPFKAYEVASFYSMFHLKPVGKYHIQVCGTTPCMLRGAESLCGRAQKHLNVGLKEVTKDGLFSIEEVECLGACVNAPVVQINDDYYEDLDEESLVKLIEECKRDKAPPPFSALGRLSSAPFDETEPFTETPKKGRKNAEA